MAERYLAEKGILQLPRREPLPQEVGTICLSKVVFEKALCSKEDPEKVQATETQALLSRLPPSDHDIWCDGSVGVYGGNQDEWSKRVVVRWEEGWYAGTINSLPGSGESVACVSLYRRQQNSEPDIWIRYDDEFEMAYSIEAENFLRDAHGHSLEYMVLKPKKVGAGAYELYSKDTIGTISAVIPAGINVSSYTAELRAMDAALDAVHEEENKTIRIFTDSLASVQALQGNIRLQSIILQRVAQKLEHISTSCNVYLAWVPSHCGVPENESVDEVAKSGLKLPLSWQINVPVDLIDAVSQVRHRTQSKSVLDLKKYDMAEENGVRLSEVTLAQFATGHVPALHPVSSYLNKKVLRCDCGTNAKKDVDHVLFRCPRTNRARRDELPAPRERKDKSMIDMIKEWPLRFLAFFKRENYL